jgi:DNA-binding NtrC family response regulator|tara:strand:- start:123 stop:545 length:423 start_codon:yes stop_codon:yes gene_type:complete
LAADLTTGLTSEDINMWKRKQHKPKELDLILLVDDDTQQLEVFAQWISSVRPELGVHTANGVTEASSLLKRNQFSAVISDYSMPDPGAGIEVFTEALYRGLPAANFIMLSGTSDELPDNIRFLRKGDLAALEALIDEVLT